MKKKLFGTIMAGILVAVSLAACGGSAKPAQTQAQVETQSQAGETQAAPAAAAKTELVIAITKDINGLDPNDPGNTLTSGVQNNMFDWLLSRSADDSIVPGLADKWEQVDDTTWKFHLREGVKFHSGNPLTSEDVRYSLMRVQGDEFAQKGNYKQIKEVNVIDDNNFEIVTDGPDPIILNRLSRLGGGILDSKLFEEIGADEYFKNPSGTGPYKFVEWSKDAKIVLEKNAEYYGDTPKWEKVTFRVIPETSTRVAELLTGGVDIALDLSSTDLEQVEANDGTHVAPFTTKRAIYWVVRTSTDGLDDIRVRQAIDYAIDDRLLLDVLYGGAGEVVKTIVAKGVNGCDESLIGTYNYDLDKAKALLKEAGREGLKFELASGNGQYAKDKELTELVATMLVEAGFDPDVNIMDTSRFTEIKNAKEFTGLRMNGYSSSMSDAATDLLPLSQDKPVQLTDWHNDKFNEIYKEVGTMMDADARRAKLAELQQIAAEELPLIPMFQMPGFYGVSDTINYAPRMDEYIYVDEITVK